MITYSHIESPLRKVKKKVERAETKSIYAAKIMDRRKQKKSKPASKNIPGPGILFVVATPIGNLEDITLRAIRTLKEVDLIAAEDTRHTRKLLSHLGISTPTISYYKEKEKERSAVIITKLEQGLNIALVSDAGTPGISDPGSILVHEAVDRGIRVEPVPGPSSLTAAVSVAGIRENSFIFLGFAPSRKKQRQDLLHTLSREKRQMVFFEAPHRLQSFLEDCSNILGDRQILWFRELTKMHEEQTRESLGAVLARCAGKKIKGESVLIITGAEDAPELSEEKVKTILATYKEKENISLKDAVQLVARTHNLSRTTVYRLALEIWR